MAWEQLSINKPHLVYIILGGFTSIFMLCSSVIKERFYIGEATVATICGIIFGPHAADLINPLTWGNTDQITEEFSRIVLVVQCFAVGVELPKAYMERHWKSVVMLLVPVMTFGWLITSLFIWGLFSSRLNWLDSLTVAACVTATDPVLASSVVGKGKFARRVPRHLRDLLSAESGCNDGMAFPFIYLALYLIRYRPHGGEVMYHWFCFSILYECVFGAFYGVCIGYIARRLIRYAHEKDLIDRESFLVFYFVLALFCAGSGSLLGLDDLLVGFAAGVGFSNDGWFQEKTEESHVSNVIDLLINLSFFVYFGTIIPWDQYDSDVLGLKPWKLIVLGILVILFRRIPIMLACKPFIPDIKTWREALFAGHFGPIGVGAIFVAILARAELETEETTPLAVIPPPGFPHRNIIELIWPITTFLVIISIIIHGSSIAVFTLGKHINTLTLTMSYTKDQEDGPNWMERLPRIQSRSKSSMSRGRLDDTDLSSLEEKGSERFNGPLIPSGLPRGFLKRQKEEDDGRGGQPGQRKHARRKKWDAGKGPGGPISQSAIGTVEQRRDGPQDESSPGESETLHVNSDESSDRSKEKSRNDSDEPEEEIYQEGHDAIIEDEEGNVLEVYHDHGEPEKERDAHVKADARRLMNEKHVEHGVSKDAHKGEKESRYGENDDQDEEQPGQEASEFERQMAEESRKAKESVEQQGGMFGGMLKKMQSYRGFSKQEQSEPPKKEEHRKKGPALAYQYGSTIIVEDEDGEVLKKYDIPAAGKQQQRPKLEGRKSSVAADTYAAMSRLGRMSSILGIPEPTRGEASGSVSGPSGGDQEQNANAEDDDDDGVRFTIAAGGRRMSKTEFIQQIQKLDPKSRANFVEDSNAPEPVKAEARAGASEHRSMMRGLSRKFSRVEAPAVVEEEEEEHDASGEEGVVGRMRQQRPELYTRDTDASNNLTLATTENEHVPVHSISDDLARFNFGRGQTGAQRRRMRLSESQTPSGNQRGQQGSISASDRYANIERSEGGTISKQHHSKLEEAETAAERRRRLGALGMGQDDDSDSDSDSSDEERSRAPDAPRKPEPAAQRMGIRFADAPKPQHAAGAGGLNIRKPGPASAAGTPVNSPTAGPGEGGGGGNATGSSSGGDLESGEAAGGNKGQGWAGRLLKKAKGK